MQGSVIQPPATSSGERLLVVALVLALHFGLILMWLMQPKPATVAVSEMSVSVALRRAEVAQAEPVPLPAPPKARVEPAAKPVLKPPVQETIAAPAPPVVAVPTRVVPEAEAAAPVIDTAPDHRAAYLNNPRPAYPMAARRMGWEGRVVLNVEVLATGACGEVRVSHSSGHEVLDNAALRTVKGWRFVPASHAGQAITQWFKVPIQFSLKENEA